MRVARFAIFSKARHELRTAVGVARIVDGVDADEDAPGLQDLGPGQPQGQEYRVAGRDVGGGDAPADLVFRTSLGNLAVPRQGRSAQAERSMSSTRWLRAPMVREISSEAASSTECLWP